MISSFLGNGETQACLLCLAWRRDFGYSSRKIRREQYICGGEGERNKKASEGEWVAYLRRFEKARVVLGRQDLIAGKRMRGVGWVGGGAP